MRVTPSEQAWLDQVAAAGMTVAARALDWAQGSHWAGQCDSLRGVVDCLDADVQDGDLHGAPSRKVAQLYIAALRKAAEQDVAAPTAPAPAPASTPKHIDRIRAVWGTDDPDVAIARVGWPDEATGTDRGAWWENWQGPSTALMARAQPAPGEGGSWRRAAPDQPWILHGREAEDPTDYMSGWGNAYGE